jgi:hypothetical protein
MPTESVLLVCPSCETQAEAGTSQCDNCRFLHIGKLKRVVVAQSETTIDAPATHPVQSVASSAPDQAQQPGTSPKNDGLVLIGWITAVLVPIVGLVIGVIVSSRDDKRGTHIAITAVGVIVAWTLLWIILIVTANSNAAASALAGHMPSLA